VAVRVIHPSSSSGGPSKVLSVCVPLFRCLRCVSCLPGELRRTKVLCRVQWANDKHASGIVRLFQPIDSIPEWWNYNY
jgi:hypothetical protein